MQLVADAVVPGGVATGLVSMPEEYEPPAPGTREIVGSATLQVCVPDAPLPPPFPTSRPYRSVPSQWVWVVPSAEVHSEPGASNARSST